MGLHFKVIVSFSYIFCIFVISCVSGLVQNDFRKSWVLEADIDLENLREITTKYDLKIEEEIVPGFYLVRESQGRKQKRTKSLPKLSSLTKHSGILQFDLQIKRKRVLRNSQISFNDPEWNKQWYLNDKLAIPSMNIRKVWQKGIVGKGVVIGIVDNGVDSRHTDLATKESDYSYDYINNDNNASPSNKKANHGTKCAGVAVAVANNRNCIAGAALKAKFASLRVMDDFGTTDYSEASSLKHELSYVHIYSNSWGVEDGQGFDGPKPVVKKSIEYGIKHGRNGKGSIYVWAAGNGGSSDNCNCDGYVNSIYTIAISSITSDQYAAYYSEYCSAVLASTYSADDTMNNVLTTDTNGGCANFTGTSASAPMAAAIIALAIEANPNITWRDVQHLIVRTSQKHNLRDGKWITNGGGLQVSHLFGYGLMDADLLVANAKTWLLVPCKTSCSEQIPTYVEKNTNGSAGVSSSYISNSCNGTENEVLYLEHVEVDVTFTATKHGSVLLSLTSPFGTVSEILSQRSSDFHAGRKSWVFMSVQFWGENPTGKWILKMNIPEVGQRGTLHRWSLILHGTRTDPTLGRPNDNERDTKCFRSSKTEDDEGNNGTQTSTPDTITIIYSCVISFGLLGVTVTTVVIIVIKQRARKRISHLNKENKIEKSIENT